MTQQVFRRGILTLCAITLIACMPGATAKITTWLESVFPLASLPVVPDMSDPLLRDHVLAILQHGQSLGNNRYVFAKVGDSLTDTPHFLHDVVLGQSEPAAYSVLMSVVERYSSTLLTVHGETANSFTRWSVAAMAGAISRDILNPQARDPEQCLVDETPLGCELRLLRPAIALIMIGTNDVERGDPDSFRASLQRMVDMCTAAGVIPVLSTIPDRLRPGHPGSAQDALLPQFNAVIVETAAMNYVPLWNLWLALQPLPNRGLDPDGIHLSVLSEGQSAVFTPEGLHYGQNMRNLTALQMLAALDALLPE